MNTHLYTLITILKHGFLLLGFTTLHFKYNFLILRLQNPQNKPSMFLIRILEREMWVRLKFRLRLSNKHEVSSHDQLIMKIITYAVFIICENTSSFWREIFEDIENRIPSLFPLLLGKFPTRCCPYSTFRPHSQPTQLVQIPNKSTLFLHSNSF